MKAQLTGRTVTQSGGGINNKTLKEEEEDAVVFVHTAAGHFLSALRHFGKEQRIQTEQLFVLTQEFFCLSVRLCG